MYYHVFVGLDNLLWRGWLHVFPSFVNLIIVNIYRVFISQITKCLWIGQLRILVFHEELDSITTGTTGETLIDALRWVDAEISYCFVGMERTEALM